MKKLDLIQDLRRILIFNFSKSEFFPDGLHQIQFSQVIMNVDCYKHWFVESEVFFPWIDRVWNCSNLLLAYCCKLKSKSHSTLTYSNIPEANCFRNHKWGSNSCGLQLYHTISLPEGEAKPRLTARDSFVKKWGNSIPLI